MSITSYIWHLGDVCIYVPQDRCLIKFLSTELGNVILYGKDALLLVLRTIIDCSFYKLVWVSKKVQVDKDQEKAQSEKDSHSKNRGGKVGKKTN